MEAGLFLGVAAACFAVGFPCRNKWQLLAAVAVWVLGLGIAALAGAFHATADDNSLGAFVFTGLPTVVWPGAFSLGVATGVLVRKAQASR